MIDTPPPARCSRCGCERDTRGWYCKACRRTYMQAWRAKEQRELAWLRKITKGLQRAENRPSEAGETILLQRNDGMRGEAK
jgi:hypothetical protein